MGNNKSAGKFPLEYILEKRNDMVTKVYQIRFSAAQLKLLKSHSSKKAQREFELKDDLKGRSKNAL
jgi:hypothetical protein